VGASLRSSPQTKGRSRCGRDKRVKIPCICGKVIDSNLALFFIDWLLLMLLVCVCLCACVRVCECAHTKCADASAFCFLLANALLSFLFASLPLC
jgi:hypothetical protein